MSFQNHETSSTFTKMQQVYWEAKRVLKSTLGKQDDECLISNDLELDTRLQLLQSADNSFSHLVLILQKYNITLKNLKDAEESLSIVLQECGALDATKAGKVMSISGKALSRISRKRSPLQCMVVKLISDIQTFQQTATVDAINTVSRMEQSRQSYRSGLMWLKKESRNLDPEAFQRLKKFRKVQDHIKRLQIRFSKSKLETLQKIDLYLLSRCNLFSQSLVPYRREFCKMTSSSVAKADYAIRSISTGCHYKFETLKELNEYIKQQEPKTCQKPHHKHQKNINSSGKKTNPEINLENDSNPSNSDVIKSSSDTDISSRDKNQQAKEELMTNMDQQLIDLSIVLDNKDQNSLTAESQISQTCGKYSQDLQLLQLNFYQNNLQTGNQENQSCGKYSDDLLSIKLDYPQTVNQYEFQAGDFINFKEQMEMSEDIFRFDKEVPEQDFSDLMFWNLMENWKNDNILSLPSEKSRKNLSEKIPQINLLSEFDPLSFEHSQDMNDFEDCC